MLTTMESNLPQTLPQPIEDVVLAVNRAAKTKGRVIRDHVAGAVNGASEDRVDRFELLVLRPALLIILVIWDHQKMGRAWFEEARAGA